MSMRLILREKMVGINKLNFLRVSPWIKTIIAAAIIYVPLFCYAEENMPKLDAAPQQQQMKAMETPPTPITILPEITSFVNASNENVNRIVCPVNIKDAGEGVIYSKEKMLDISIKGQNVFVKFKVMKVTKEDPQKEGRLIEEMLYSTRPSEMFIVCGDQVFNLLLNPSPIPPQTIRLSFGNTDKVKSNMGLYKEIPFENVLVNIIRRVYMDDIPASFTILSVNNEIGMYEELALHLKRVVRVEGEGIQVKEYIAKSKVDSFDMDEKTFLIPELTNKPIAISIDSYRLKRGETARVFIVERYTEGN